MNKLIFTGVLCGLATLAAPAFAYDDDYNYQRSDYAEVLSARPIVRQVRYSEPRQECWDERVAYRDPPRYAIGPGTIIGGVLGGVIGHQFGGGRGRDVATAVGAVIGASAGQQQDAYAYGGYRGGTEHVGYQQRCRTIDNYRVEDRIDGYDVTYRYHGRIYNTRLPYDPGRRLAVNVEVSPARD